MTPNASRVRPYKDFLTPALHRRFMAALSACIALCYFESIILGEKNSFFWVWFPLGRTGIRAGLIFISALCVFLLRIAQLHVGQRTSFSGWQTFRAHAFRFQNLQTITWYCLSAYLYSEVYIWSSSADAALSRTRLIPRSNRSTLNERPIYFICFFFFLALSQVTIHLFYDYDRIEIPVTKNKLADDSTAEKTSSPFQKLKYELPSLLLSSAKRTVVITFTSPFFYAFNFHIYPYSIRRLAWNLNRSWAKIFWTLPKSSSLPTNWPFHWSMFWSTASSGFLLVTLWEVTNAAFSIYSAQEPLKKGRPITSKSRDPNGSLLTGLRSKKLQIRVYAFWELVYISQRLKDRRKAIYEDIDRSGGSCWSQIRNACLEVMNEMQARIENYERPSVSIDNTDEKFPSLPRLSEPLKDGLQSSGDIFSTTISQSSPMQNISRTVGRLAKSQGQSYPANLSPRTKKLLQAAERVVFTKQKNHTLSKLDPHGLVKRLAMRFLKTQLGWPFRQEYRRRLNAIVLGTPFGDVGLIVNAVQSLVRLAVHSLSEDQYGNVQRDIKDIVKTFTIIISILENLQASIGRHWTDVMAVQKSPEFDQILFTLKNGLGDLLDAFGKYSDNLGISQRDLKMAKEAALIKEPKQQPEMQMAS